MITIKYTCGLWDVYTIGGSPLCQCGKKVMLNDTTYEDRSLPTLRTDAKHVMQEVR